MKQRTRYPRPFTAKWDIPMEDAIVHTDERPQCDDPSCPCHAEMIERKIESEHDEHVDAA